MSSNFQEEVDYRRQTVDLTSTSVARVQGGYYDRRASLPQRLNSTGSGNRSLLEPSTESGHSAISSMLYITSSQCASPSFGPIVPHDEVHIDSQKPRESLPIITEEFESGLATMLRGMATSERIQGPFAVPTREPIYQNDTFEPQVLSYDLEQEQHQDAPMPYRRFAYDKDVTPKEWSILREVRIYTTIGLESEQKMVL